MNILVTTYYKSDNPRRQSEIDYCLHQNIGNPLIDVILLFSGVDIPSTSTKIKVVKQKNNDRYYFSDIFNYIKSVSGDYPDAKFLLANSDIHFDGTLSELDRITLEGKGLFLTRQDNPKMQVPMYNSQDVWIFTASSLTDVIVDESKFKMGIRGCDNKLAYVFEANGIHTYNPHESIYAIHIHQSQHRTYSNTEVVPPPYHYPINITIDEMVAKGL
jgi:hypothetical protein